MLVFKVSEEIPDNREFYEVRKFDEDFTRIPRGGYENPSVGMCETKTYQRISFKHEGKIINVVAGDEISDQFFKSFIEYEKLTRESVNSHSMLNEIIEHRNDELKKINVKIETLRGRILDLNAILSSKDIVMNQIKSSLYYKIGKFLRLI